MNKKGITMTSLTIYVIVATIIVFILVFLNANFFSNINDLTDKANIVSECLNFKSALIRDIKAENDVKVTDYNQNMVRLSNDVKYEIRVLDKNVPDDEKKYAIYRNDVQIARSVVPHTQNDGQSVKEGPYFEYDVNTNTLKVGMKFSDGVNSYIEDGSYIIGKEIQITWTNSNNFYVPSDDDVEEPGSGEDNPPSVEVPAEEKVYVVLYTDGTLSISNSGEKDATKEVLADYGEISLSIASGNPLWLANNEDIISVDFAEQIKLPSMENLFLGCTNLESVSNMQNVDTSNVVNASNAFSGCSSLKNIDISRWDTSNVTNMSSMFEECSSLNSVNLNTFKTDKVEDMSNMFDGCS